MCKEKVWRQLASRLLTMKRDSSRSTASPLILDSLFFQIAPHSLFPISPEKRAQSEG